MMYEFEMVKNGTEYAVSTGKNFEEACSKLGADYEKCRCICRTPIEEN